MKRFKDSNLYKIVRCMPPLYHKLPGEEFDIRKSRIIWWLTKQPEMLEYVWNRIKQSGAVKYDPKTGKWQGVDVQEEDND